jgi:hypothetical protein
MWISEIAANARTTLSSLNPSGAGGVTVPVVLVVPVEFVVPVVLVVPVVPVVTVVSVVTVVLVGVHATTANTIAKTRKSEIIFFMLILLNKIVFTYEKYITI